MINVELHCILWVPSSTATLNNSVNVRVFESKIKVIYSEQVTKFKNMLSTVHVRRKRYKQRSDLVLNGQMKEPK